MNKVLSNNKDKNSGNASKNSITSKITNVLEKGKETLNVVKEKGKEVANVVKEKGKEVANVVKEKAQNVSGQIKNTVKPEDKPIVSSSMFTFDSISEKTSQFADSNTAITKFVFIVILLLLKVVLFKIGSWFIKYFILINFLNPKFILNDFIFLILILILVLFHILGGLINHFLAKLLIGS